MRFFKVTLLGLLCVFSLWVLMDLVRQARADALFHSATTIDALRQARRLDPGRAAIAQEEADRWLAAFPPRPDQAAQAYRAAARLSPYDAFCWLGLARAAWRLERTTQTLRALTMADRVDPVNQMIQMEQGNLYLEIGDEAQALAHHARAIAMNADLAYNLCPYYIGRGMPPRVVAERLLGRNAPLLETFFYIQLKGEIEPAAAASLWQYVSGLPGGMGRASYLHYYDYLLSRKDYPAARALWGAMAQKFYRRPWDEAREPFWNGDLESEPQVSGGLEWQIAAPMPAGCSCQFGALEPGSRARTLGLHFDGSQNLAFSHVCHGFFVEPGRSYVLRCHVRTRDLTTDNGLYLLVSLPGKTPGRVQSHLFTESGTWEAALGFTAPPGCGWAELVLRRDPSTRLNNKLKGDAWFGPCTLEAQPGPPRGDGKP